MAAGWQGLWGSRQRAKDDAWLSLFRPFPSAWKLVYVLATAQPSPSFTAQGDERQPVTSGRVVWLCLSFIIWARERLYLHTSGLSPRICPVHFSSLLS